MRAPLQSRSQETLNRIVRAAETLLSERAWDSIPFRELIAEAGVSVGSFYARFDDKEALLDHLDDLYVAEVKAMINDVALKIARAKNLKTASTTLVTSIHKLYSNKKGATRALVMRARYGHAGASERTNAMTGAAPAILDAFEIHKKEIVHSAWRSAVGEAAAVAFHAIREQLLFPQSLALPISESRTLTLVNRLFYLHLTTRENQ